MNAPRPTRRLGALLLPALALAAGCGDTFYSQASANALLETRTTTTFGRSLPDAAEEMFDVCHGGELSIDPGTTSWSPGGTCSLSALSPEAQLLAVAAATLPAVDLSDAFPGNLERKLQDIYHVEDVFPWPFQNCEVYLDMDLTATSYVANILGISFPVDLGLQLAGFDVDWVTRGGEPSLRLDFDQKPGAVFATGTVDGDVDCPSALNEPVLQPHVPDGTMSLALDSLDVDVWFAVEPDGAGVRVTTHAAVSLGALEADPPLSSQLEDRVGSMEDLLADYAGVDLADIEADAAALLAGQMADVGAQLEQMIDDAIPSGDTVQSVSISGGELVVVSTRPRLPTKGTTFPGPWGSWGP